MSGERPPPKGPRDKTLVVDARPQGAGRTKALLTVLSGLEAGRIVPIPESGPLALGRGEEAGLRFDDASVSSVHANVALVLGDVVFSDNRSTNGSFVNDARVTGTVQLRDGDRIQLGSRTFLRFARVDAEEEEALRRVYDAALRDGLTGLYNRRHLEERLSAEISFALRHGTHLAVAMLDVDHFKRVNDTHGHPGGDAVLRAVASILTRGVRAEDLVARYGGEEFIVAVRGVDLAGAFTVADRLRQQVQAAAIPFGGAPIRVTASFGVASLACCPPAQRDRSTLVALADARLYRAKEQGRNRVVG